jgi:hypothetical protein
MFVRLHLHAGKRAPRDTVLFSGVVGFEEGYEMSVPHHLFSLYFAMTGRGLVELEGFQDQLDPIYGVLNLNAALPKVPKGTQPEIKSTIVNHVRMREVDGATRLWNIKFEGLSKIIRKSFLYYPVSLSGAE